MPGVFDHVLAGLMLIVWPLWIARYGREGMQELADEPHRRLRTYLQTMGSQWGHAVVILSLWIALGRPWGDLGLALDLGWGFAIAAVLTILAVGAMWRQRYRTARDPQVCARLREQVREVEGIVPANGRETGVFRALAVTAGFCEELAYRGFLLWYLGAFMPLALAILAMALAFGLAHLYQGRTAAAQVAGIGTIAALLYVLSGSLWIPMLLHTVFDLHQLALVRVALRFEPSEGGAAAAVQ